MNQEQSIKRLEEISKQFPEPLSLGSRGEGVRVLQFFLSYAAAFNDFVSLPSQSLYVLACVRLLCKSIP